MSIRLSHASTVSIQQLPAITDLRITCTCLVSILNPSPWMSFLFFFSKNRNPPTTESNCLSIDVGSRGIELYVHVYDQCLTATIDIWVKWFDEPNLHIVVVSDIIQFAICNLGALWKLFITKNTFRAVCLPKGDWL